MGVIAKAFNSFKNGGLKGLVLSSCHFAIKQLSKANASDQYKSDEKNYSGKVPIKTTLDRYRFTCDNPFGNAIEPTKIDTNTINWFVPNFENSSGGHLTVFRLIKDLENLGFKNHIIFEPSAKQKSVEELRKAINENFLHLNCPISVGTDNLAPAYFSFATNWTTAYLLKNFASTIQKCYLLQDYEPYFYPPGTDYYLAERTYGFDFTTFTGGDWIASLLKLKHQVSATVFPFGCDKGLYTPAQANDKANDGKSKKKLLFYARPSTPRRGFELAMLAFEKLFDKLNNVEIILAGSDFSNYALPEHIKSVGIVPMLELPALYRNCDAALVISFTNVSLLPLDLMASGCAVVSNSGPQVEWLLNDENSTLTQADPDSLAFALEKILANDKLRQQQINRAYKYVADKDWYKAAQMITISLRSMQAVQSNNLQAQKIGVK